MLEIGKSLSTTKIKFCFWELQPTYIRLNRIRNIHAKVIQAWFQDVWLHVINKVIVASWQKLYMFTTKEQYMHKKWLELCYAWVLWSVYKLI